MKLMQDPMDDRREHDTHDSYEYQSTKKRIAGRKEFRASGLKGIDRTHPSQNH